VIEELTKFISDFKVERQDEMTILAILGKVKFSLFYYPYPLLFETTKFEGLNIANVKDIAAMKINAILGRGTKKDFIDLYCIIDTAKLLTLSEILDLYQQKYTRASSDMMHVIQSLNYFTNAENGQVDMLIPLD
jgi:predicted nucleotidyltransferase component of viral defense system